MVEHQAEVVLQAALSTRTIMTSKPTTKITVIFMMTTMRHMRISFQTLKRNMILKM